MNSNFHRAALSVGLRKMFEKDSFSICDFDAMAKLAGVHISTKDYEALRVLHCVKYGDMPQAVRQQLFDVVTGAICGPATFDLDSLEPVRALTEPVASHGTITVEVKAEKRKLFGLLPL